VSIEKKLWPPIISSIAFTMDSASARRRCGRSGLLFVSEGDAGVAECLVKCVAYGACRIRSESLAHPLRDSGGVHLEMCEADREIGRWGWHRLGRGFRGWRDWSLLTESSQVPALALGAGHRNLAKRRAAQRMPRAFRYNETIPAFVGFY
jgi:hypothetical protein